MYISSVQESQTQYLDLLTGYKDVVFSDDVNQKQIAMILDEIHCFWLDKKDVLALELEDLSSKKECIMLTGAIYLDVADNEHYMFKALGQEHIISDPLLKLEHFFRTPQGLFNVESIELFRRAYNDVLNILSKFQNNFYILPISLIAIENQEEHLELLQKFFLNFVNTMLNENLNSFDNFFEKYSTYTEIEKKLIPYFKSTLKYNDCDETGWSLRDKVEAYIQQNSAIATYYQDRTEAEKFIGATQSLVSQILAILMISSITNITPFIRFRPTFNYLTTVMYTFIEDGYIKKMIEKTIIFYIFYYYINKSDLAKIDFSDYAKIVNETNFLNLILQEVREQNIDIFHGGVDKVQKIIEEQFCKKIYI